MSLKIVFLLKIKKYNKKKDINKAKHLSTEEEFNLKLNNQLIILITLIKILFSNSKRNILYIKYFLFS